MIFFRLLKRLGDILEIKTRVCWLQAEQIIATHLLEQGEDLRWTENTWS
jgi:hypothetical protein